MCMYTAEQLEYCRSQKHLHISSTLLFLTQFSYQPSLLWYSLSHLLYWIDQTFFVMSFFVPPRWVIVGAVVVLLPYLGQIIVNYCYLLLSGKCIRQNTSDICLQNISELYKYKMNPQLDHIEGDSMQESIQESIDDNIDDRIKDKIEDRIEDNIEDSMEDVSTFRGISSNEQGKDVYVDVDEMDDDYEEEYEEVPHKNYGCMIPIGKNADGTEKYLLGPHYYVFLLAWVSSLALIVYLLTAMYPLSPNSPFVCSIAASFLYAYVYLKMGLSNPGIASSPVIPDHLNPGDSSKYCVPCKIVRGRGTRHCYYCDVCIFGYDHHCPWVGKCVGRDNLKLFYLFLMTVGLLFATLLLTAIMTGGLTPPTL